MGFTFGRKRKSCASLDCLSEASLEIAYQQLKARGMFRTPEETKLMGEVRERLRAFGVEER